MKKQTLRIALLAGALSAVTFTGMTRAADDTAASKPADTTPPTPPPASANRPRRQRPNPAEMLKNFRDQFEGLNLSDDQMKKIDGFLATAQTEVDKAKDATDPETRRGAFQAMQKLNEDVQSVLTDEQKTALRVKRMTAGLDRMKTTFTADELKLTDDQKTKIGAIIDDAKKEAATATPSGDQQADRQKFMEKYRELRDKLNAVLTPDQQKMIPQGGPGGRRGPGGGSTGATPPPPAN